MSARTGHAVATFTYHRCVGVSSARALRFLAASRARLNCQAPGSFSWLASSARLLALYSRNMASKASRMARAIYRATAMYSATAIYRATGLRNKRREPRASRVPVSLH